MSILVYSSIISMHKTDFSLEKMPGLVGLCDKSTMKPAICCIFAVPSKKKPLISLVDCIKGTLVDGQMNNVFGKRPAG